MTAGKPAIPDETRRTEDALEIKPELLDVALCAVVNGALVVRSLPAGGALIAGRSPEAGLRIEHATLSRRHARFTREGRVLLQDLGSTNGTRVGGRALAPGESVEIGPHDSIQLGGVPVFLLRSGLAARGAPPAVPVAPAGPEVLLESPRMRAIYDLAERVAASDISVLILGETGVGKDVLAQSIHRASPRARSPFLGVNCGAFSDALLESELFGHEKGAFTSAVQSKPGIFERADGGTLFLDEVGEMSPSLQVKLLRVLEERRITRVGGVKPRDVDVRVLAATHRSLPDEIAAGRLRQDLYFRLNGISISIPPLRERRIEIEGFARLFLAGSAEKSGRPVPALSGEALLILEGHAWPGNIRELRNVMARASVLAGEGPILPQHLPDEMVRAHQVREPSAVPDTIRFDPTEALPPASEGEGEGEDEERRRVLDALVRCGGNQTHAARMLGMARGTLIARMELYGVPRPRRRKGG